MKMTNKNEFELLVSELGKNPSLAKGFQKRNVKLPHKEQWEAIATKLNALGPPIRDSSGWQKVWKDLKFKVKKKMVYNKNEANATGGGVFKQIPLSSLEESVANLVQFDKLISPQGLSFGVANLERVDENAERAENVIPELTEPCAPTTSEMPCSSKAKKTSQKKLNKEDVLHYIKNQGEVQKKNNEETLKTLKAIENHLKDSAYYQRKMSRLSEERVNFLKRQAEKQEEIMDLDREIKKKKLEVLQKQLDAIME